MRIRHTLLILFLMPVLLPALIALLINFWSLFSLRAQHEQAGELQRQEVALLTEAAQLNEEMAGVQRKVSGALEAANGKHLNEAQLYLIHTGVVDQMDKLVKRVLLLSESAQVREASMEDALALPEHARSYSNFVIMATDIAAIDPGTAIRHIGNAQQHFISFSEHAFRISARLADRMMQRDAEAERAFTSFFVQVLLLGLAGMAGAMLLAVFSSRKIGRHMGEVADALWELSHAGNVAPELAKIEKMRNSSNSEFRAMAGAVLDFRSALIGRKKAELQAYQLAYYDPLTLLPNRRLLTERLTQAFTLSGRTHFYGAILLLDLDNFKTINETKGHEIGDQLLIEVARRITDHVRAGDSVVRLGGDEFVVVLETLSAKADSAAAQAELMAESIRTELVQPYVLDGCTLYTTPSIGVAMFKGAQNSVEELLKSADIAMYQAKDAGRNTIRFLDPNLQSAIQARADLESELRRALENHELQIYCQVQVDGQGRPLGAEALLRWSHPVRGMIPPGEFIPLAEENGLIVPIGLWVMEKACHLLADWQHSPALRDLTLAVNVSAKQFRQADFNTRVAHVLQESGAKPSHLKLELTETVVLENIEDTIEKMRELKLLGVCFSLDDFGTGYSSLQYLKQLPLDQIKIDQSFVRDLASDPNDAAIVQTIIAMSEALGLNVIAEGVETQAQRDFLDSHGCHTFQGFLFGKPMPLDRFEAAIHRMGKADSPLP